MLLPTKNVFEVGQVFEAEKQVTKTGVIHKHCLACNVCYCNLDASSFFNGADGEVGYIILFLQGQVYKVETRFS